MNNLILSFRKPSFLRRWQKGITFLLLMLLSISVLAQQKSVSGKVTDEMGTPITGVSVKIKGTSTGTLTNVNGNYSLVALPGDVLLFSYVGMQSKDILVGASSTYNIVLEEDAKLVQEVVVTALGIKREQKALGYSVQTVKGENLQKVLGVDVATSLTGKISGLLVKNSPDFASVPNITIRGENPLMVIDGVVYSNKNISDIPSGDIESINVLKGATASALYGYKGAGGAILIITKNGSTNKIGLDVNLNSTTMFTAGYLAIPKKQSMYGRGANNTYDKYSDSSWGTLMDGTVREQWDPFLMDFRNYEYLPIGKDNFKNFLENGYVTNNSVSVAYKSNNAAIRSSLNWIENKGQYPNSKLDKYSYTIGADINTDRFKLTSNLAYSKKNVPNLGSNGYTSYDPMYSLLIWSAADYNILDYKNNYWLKKDEVQNFTYRLGSNNPYFDRYERTNESTRDIFNADVTAGYQIVDWLKVTVRAGLDFYTDQGKQRVSWGSYTSMGNTSFPGNQWPWNGAWKGAYNTGQTQGFSLNTDFIVNGEKTFDKLGVEYLLGSAISYKKDENIFGQTVGGLSIPGFFSLKASVDKPSIGQSMLRRQVNSLYGRVAFSWDRLIYLDLTGRNDWSSTLSAEQRSYFYPSSSASFVVSELFPDTKNWLDLFKVRLSWTQSKDMAPEYSINPTYTVNSGTWGDANGASAPSSLYPSIITPSGSKTWETGFLAVLLKNRLSVDFTYYDKNMYDGIITGPISPSTGYSGVFTNTKESISRRGLEFTLNAAPIKEKDWQWDVTFNWSKFARYFTRLDPDFSQKAPWIAVGERVDAFISKDILKVPATGQYIVNNGRLQYSQYNSVFGYYDPDWLWGLNTTLRYKNWSLFVSMDGVVGGLTNARTESYMWQSGSHPNSLTPERAQDVADPANGHYLVDGVKVASGSVTYDKDGNITSDTRTYSPNDTYISYKQYVIDLHNSSAWGGNGSPADTYAKTFFKLREVSLTYTIPTRFLYNVVKSASISFIGQNVLLWAKDFKYSDPDGGVEDFADPAVRYLGFNIKLTF